MVKPIAASDLTFPDPSLPTLARLEDGDPGSRVIFNGIVRHQWLTILNYPGEQTMPERDVAE
jgi:hypothetical protein